MRRPPKIIVHPSGVAEAISRWLEALRTPTITQGGYVLAYDLIDSGVPSALVEADRALEALEDGGVIERVTKTTYGPSEGFYQDRNRSFRWTWRRAAKQAKPTRKRRVAKKGRGPVASESKTKWEWYV